MKIKFMCNMETIYETYDKDTILNIGEKIIIHDKNYIVDNKGVKITDDNKTIMIIILKEVEEKIFDIKKAKENSDKNFDNKLKDIFKEISKRIKQASDEGVYYVEFPTFREKDVKYGDKIIKKLKDEGYNISDQGFKIIIKW